MALAVSTLVQRIRYELGDFPFEDPSCTAASGVSTITGATANGWAQGDIGEFVTDGDTFRTISLAATTITATRSYNGTTGAAHAAERVLKNPRYTYIEIKNAVSSVINDLPWRRVYKKATLSPAITPSNSTVWYDLTATTRGLISVSQAYGPAGQVQGIYGIRHAAPRLLFRRNLPAALVASTVGLMFPDGFYHDTNDVVVEYAAKITDGIVGGNYSDLTAGDTVVEAIIFGAVSHLESAKEQGKPRQPREDRETLRGAALFARKYDDAIHRATMECRDTIPMMRRWSSG